MGTIMFVGLYLTILALGIYLYIKLTTRNREEQLIEERLNTVVKKGKRR